MEDLFAVLSFRAGYNTALVSIGASLLGAASGACGVFLVLRKRALVSDAISHATLPGVVAAFFLMVAFGGDGRWLPGLLLGSALSAGLGVWCIQAIVARTRLSEDAAIGAVLSTFFGLGIVGLTVIQSAQLGRPAGLETFLLGSTAGMLRSEAVTIAVAALMVVILLFILRREITLTAFQYDYAFVNGIAVARADFSILLLSIAVTVIGLKIVGAVLSIALLITPAVTARFWTNRSDHMIWIAGFLGALSGYIGSVVSALYENVPTGPVIVLTASVLFFVSLLFAPHQGLLMRALRSSAAKAESRVGSH